MESDLHDYVQKCLEILDENIYLLTEIESDLQDEKEDVLESDMQLHNLYDMAEDVSETTRLKHAEMNFVRRQAEDLL